MTDKELSQPYLGPGLKWSWSFSVIGVPPKDGHETVLCYYGNSYIDGEATSWNVNATIMPPISYFIDRQCQ